ncbi:29456_t:CDS:2 [Racocetra persica]|uniref:29456_t:CDS:1 n=1 Tax=Racocetra persica TaxID=160502 RepID=A0ACA9KHS4_9GLOM|nr:29456_t:CDS:2 [Racocetra persica]
MHTGIPVDARINFHPGVCFIRAVTLGVINPMIRGYWKCCEKDLNSSGCEKVYSCCKNNNDGCRNNTVAAMDRAQVKNVNTYMTLASIKLANYLVVQFAKTVVKR